MVIFYIYSPSCCFVVLLATLSEVAIYTKILLYYFPAYWLVIVIATSDQYGTAYTKCPVNYTAYESAVVVYAGPSY